MRPGVNQIKPTIIQLFMKDEGDIQSRNMGV